MAHDLAVIVFPQVGLSPNEDRRSMIDKGYTGHRLVPDKQDVTSRNRLSSDGK
jgi:hypothetical protein